MFQAKAGPILPVTTPADRSETDRDCALPAPLDCQGARGQCTKRSLLSGNRLQKRDCGHPAAPL